MQDRPVRFQQKLAYIKPSLSPGRLPASGAGVVIFGRLHLRREIALGR